MLPSENSLPEPARATLEVALLDPRPGLRKRMCASGDQSPRASGPEPHRSPIDPLRSSLETMTRLADGSPNSIILLDQNWRITYANTRALFMARIDPQEVNRVIFWDKYPAVLGSSLERALREVAATGFEQSLQAFYYAPFDIWVDIYIQPIGPDLGVYLRDVSSAVKSERARDRAAQQLRQVLEATTDSVLVVGRDWRICYMNERAKATLPVPHRTLGAVLWDCFPEAIYEGSPHLDNHHRAMEQGIPGDFQVYYPTPLNAWFDVSVRPIDDGIIIFFRDINKQKQAEVTLLEVEKLSVVAGLATSLAHQLNNPLAGVTNLVYLARQQAGNPAASQYLDQAEQELRRVALIANQSLRFHKQLTMPQSVSCITLFTHVLGNFESRLKNSGVQLEKRKRANTPVRCFEGEIAQVLSELISNALDAMPAGGRLVVRSRESTNCTTGQRGLTLTIADTGTGISPVTRARIFEAFFTTKGIGGVGLGLWISSEIVERHQGSLRIRSSQGATHRGTVATLFLPLDVLGKEGPPARGAVTS